MCTVCFTTKHGSITIFHVGCVFMTFIISAYLTSLELQKKSYTNIFQSPMISFNLEGPVPCFLQLDMSQMTQLAPSQTYSGKDIESCGQLCFDSIRPGFILKGSDCIILTSHSTETAERDATFYTTSKFIHYQF